VWKWIEASLKHQKQTKEWGKAAVYPLLLNLPALTETELYALSLEREPREARASDTA
jgi:hypothetical protein